MATAYLAGDVILLKTEYREEHLAKSTPGMRYHVKDDHSVKPHYAFPLSWASCVALRGTFGADLEISDDLAHWARMERDLRIRPSLALRNSLEIPEELFGSKIVRMASQVATEGDTKQLRPDQQVGAAFLATAGSAILADEMRLGKSMQAIAAARILDARPALFVVPSSTKYQWLEYLREWWPECRPVIVRGTATQRAKAIETVRTGENDVAILNWESLRLHSRQEAFGSVVSLKKCAQHGGDATERACEVHPRELNEIKFRAVVADEAHRAVHPRAKQTRALWAVAWEADYRWALTGTPVLDVPTDLWALMHLIAPNEATQKTSWIDRYCIVGFNGFAEEVIGLRPEHSAELFSYVDPRFLRRTREIVMPYLPEKIRTQRTVELSPKQRKAYDGMRKDMLAELDNGDITYVTNALTKLIRLRQFASAYGEIDPNGDLLLTAPSCKADAMVEIAEEVGNESTIVFAESRQVIEITGRALERAGYTTGYITGRISDGDRALAQAAFQTGDVQFMLCTIGAGGEGITLDRASIEVFLQRTFSLAKNSQAEDRGVGKHGLEVIDVLALDTIEYHILEILGDKAAIVEQVVRDKATYRRLLGEPG